MKLSNKIKLTKFKPGDLVTLLNHRGYNLVLEEPDYNGLLENNEVGRKWLPGEVATIMPGFVEEISQIQVLFDGKLGWIDTGYLKIFDKKDYE